MRSLLIIAALALTAPSPRPARAAGQEGGGQNPAAPRAQPPKGWHLTGGNRESYELSLDSAVRHGGGASASLKAKPAAADEGFGASVQSIRADEYRGRRVR